jgi:TRAP-type mannitol/chloroaromatic compound transport system substrate-binding protein
MRTRHRPATALTKKSLLPLLPVILTLLVRLGFIIEMRNQPFSWLSPQVVDSWVYQRWAMEIVHHNFWGKEVFFLRPLYPYLLALLYKIFGTSVLVVQIFQALLATAACYLLYRITERIFDRRTALIAGIGFSLCGVLVYYTGTLLYVEITIFLSLLILYLLLIPDKKWWQLVLAGIASGLFIICRPEMLIIFPPLIFWLKNYYHTRARQLLLFSLAGLIVILSIPVRNYLVARDPVLFTAHSGINFYFGNNPAFTFGTALPFGLNARMMNAWFYHGGGNELVNEFLAKFNVYGIPAGNTNCQMGGWFRKEIKSMADLQGLKFRVGGFAGRILQKVGVVPQQIAAGDIYPALEKGTIDAAEWVGPYDDEKLGFYKVAKYYYYPGWWEPGPCPHVIFNLAKWNELPKLYKDVCHTAAAQSNVWMMAKYDHLNPAALKRLVAQGVQLRPFPAEVVEACFAAAKELYAEIAKENEDFKKLHDSVVAYRGEQYLWWQVAEYTYDTYMIRLRSKA